MVHLSWLVQEACVEEHSFCSRGLARIDVRDDRDVANLLQALGDLQLSL